jgi:DNA-binding response OmpR family regulator
MSYATSEENEVLLVDDNMGVITMLRFALQRAGYQVRTAMSGREAVQSVERFGLPTVALVDISMADMDGFEFSRYLRQRSRVPIIMITALSQMTTVVTALSEFADDYLVKPFSNEELLARVERVLRRAERQVAEEWQAIDAHLRFNVAQQQAELDGILVDLTPLEMKLLQILAAHLGQSVPVALLLDKMWPVGESTPDKLRVTVFRLRQKLQQTRRNHDYIFTDRGVGYRLEVNDEP